MANTNAPFGLEFIATMSSTPNFELVPIIIDKDDTTKIYRNDLVKMLSTGYGAQWTATTAVSQLGGIFKSCTFRSTSEGKIVHRNYWPGADAADDVTAWCYPVQFGGPLYFRAQTDATGAVFADKYANVDIVVGTGSTDTALSGSYIDISTLAATATLPFRIIDLWGGTPPAGRGNKGPGTQSGAYNWVIVAANIGAGTTGL